MGLRRRSDSPGGNLIDVFLVVIAALLIAAANNPVSLFASDKNKMNLTK